jgi:hypothetical protein
MNTLSVLPQPLDTGLSVDATTSFQAGPVGIELETAGDGDQGGGKTLS